MHLDQANFQSFTVDKGAKMTIDRAFCDSTHSSNDSQLEIKESFPFAPYLGNDDSDESESESDSSNVPMRFLTILRKNSTNNKKVKVCKILNSCPR